MDDLRGRLALITEAAGLHHQQADAGGQMAGVHRIDPFQLLGGNDGILIGAGQLGADVEVDHFIAFLHQGTEEILELLGADSSGGGQEFLLVVSLKNQVRGNVLSVQVVVLADGHMEGNDLDPQPLFQLLGKITGAVGGDIDRLAHSEFLSFQYKCVKIANYTRKSAEIQLY
jgi:hypothetical protein